MEGTMKTAVMTKLKYCEIQERPIPQPKDDEVLVKVENVGVCGSDLHYYEAGRIGDFVVECFELMDNHPGILHRVVSAE